MLIGTIIVKKVDLIFGNISVEFLFFHLNPAKGDDVHNRKLRFTPPTVIHHFVPAELIKNNTLRKFY
jgi:hypothetical protein